MATLEAYGERVIGAGGGGAGMTAEEHGWLEYLYNKGTGGDVIIKNYYNKEYFTEEEFLDIVDNAMFYRCFVGMEVRLDNAQSISNRYMITDLNHDNEQTNTFDLECMEFARLSMAFGSSQTYSSSAVRTWINGDYYNGFSTDIKNHMATMAVPSNGTTLNDKVKIPSVSERGYADTYAPAEGTKYVCYNHIKDGTHWYWLRTRHSNNTSDVWSVNYNGYVYYPSYSNTNGCVVPAFRIGQSLQ